MIFNGNWTGITHNFTRDVDPCFEYIEKLRGGFQWCLMESEDFVWNISFDLKNENGDIVSFNCQSVTFRLSIREFEFF